MPKRIFKHFPMTPEEAASSTPEFDTICAQYGGLAFVLDSKNEVSDSFYATLKSHGYSADEFDCYRRVINCQGRERILLSLACHGHFAASSEGLLKQMYEGYFFNLSEARKAHGISFDEIASAAKQLAPLLASAPQ